MSSGTAPPGDEPDHQPDDRSDDGLDQTGAPSTGETGAASTGEPRPARDLRDRPDLARRRHPDSPVHPHRRRWLIGVLVAVLVIALGTGVTVFALQRGRTTPNPGPTGSASPTADPSAPGLTAAELMSPAQAALILPDVSWRVTSDQTGQSATGSRAACLSTEAVAQAPDPTRVLTRSLGPAGATNPSSTASPTPGAGTGQSPSGSPSGSPSASPSDSPSTGPEQNVPVVLHQALAFADQSGATETYAVYARALGNCDLAGSFIAAGSSITGLGDQSTGIVVADPAHEVDRTVVINRTGSVVNVIDLVTRSDSDDETTGSRVAPSIGAVVKALTAITDQQCTEALGVCATLVRTAAGPPPVAGDQPGFLALADIPQPQTGTGTWAGLTPGKPADLVTSGCEDVDLGDVGATTSTARSYLLSDKPAGMPQSFGLDEAVFTFDGQKDAGALAQKLNDNIKGCKQRRLTATVGGGDRIEGRGAGGVAVTATTWTIDQKVSDSVTSHFRVGVAVAGDLVVYTFLPTEGRFDLTDAQWATLTVRAAQRATQAA